MKLHANTQACRWCFKLLKKLHFVEGESDRSSPFAARHSPEELCRPDSSHPSMKLNVEAREAMCDFQ